MQRIILIIVAALSLGIAMADDTPAPAANDPRTQEIIELDRKYVEAFNKCDLDTLMSFFADDTVYDTGDGFQLKGLQQIRDVFKEEFAAPVKPQLKLEVREVKILSDDQAVEKGAAMLQNDGEEIVTDYIAEYVKRDGQWKLRRVQERDIPPAALKLQDLAWLIGDWEDTAEGVTVATSIRWSMNQGFLQRDFSSTVGRKLDVQGVEYIGWDAEDDTIRSWYFDSMGGRGVMEWNRGPDGWEIAAEGFLPNGGTASASNSFKKIDNDHLEWKSTNRIIDGNPEPDVVVKFARKNADTEGRKP
jgi:uncharacterized protein (TIGR02246 family)